MLCIISHSQTIFNKAEALDRIAKIISKRHKELIIKFFSVSEKYRAFGQSVIIQAERKYSFMALTNTIEQLTIDLTPDVKTALDEILAPVRQEFAESGMTENELDEFMNSVRNSVYQEKTANHQANVIAMLK